MIAIGLLLAFAAGLVWLSPRALTAGGWQVRAPRLALALWHLAFLLGLTAAVVSAVIAVVQTLAATGGAGPVAVAATVGGWFALAGVGGGVMIVAAGGGDVGGASRTNQGALLALPHSARALDRHTELRVCAATEPFACSVPGPRGTVLVTTGLIALLTPAQLRAVVAHERAHLSQRHHLAMRLADLQVACLPRSATARRMRRCTSLLIELIADDSAARSAGAVHLANALVRLGRATGDEAMQLRAERLSRGHWRPSSRLDPLPAVFPALAHGVAPRR